MDSGYAEIHCDGASSGNPGDAGIGIIIDIPSKGRAFQISEYIGITTNNVAEYSALIKGLEKARALGVKRIKAFLDSELVVRQINGIYRVKNKNLLPLWIKARRLLDSFEDYKVIHIDRKENRDADRLAKDAIKRRTKGEKENV
jgi:ribonuclease HI